MLKKTPLYDEHLKLKGRIVDFGGWALPVQYSGVMAEHLACRQAAGLFDVSHMGEIRVEGSDAEAYLNELVTNDVSKLAIGQALYTVMCHDDGGIVDDLVIYRIGREHFLAVVNASNTDKDFQHFTQVYTQLKPKNGKLRITNESSKIAQIALQGPQAAKILSQITSESLSTIRTYWFKEGRLLNDTPALIARTGYTGEDGFELYLDSGAAPKVWRVLLEKGAVYDLKPCGLAARDTLRLEMKYPLYGNELSDTTHPLEAGLGWVVKFNKASFVGRSALLKAKELGPKRQLVGLQVTGRGIPRHGYEIYSADGTQKIGEVTSGTQSPSLNSPIGMGYLSDGFSKVGTPVNIQIRGMMIAAEVVSTPFYKTQKSQKT